MMVVTLKLDDAVQIGPDTVIRLVRKDKHATVLLVALTSDDELEVVGSNAPFSLTVDKNPGKRTILRIQAEARVKVLKGDAPTPRMDETPGLSPSAA